MKGRQLSVASSPLVSPGNDVAKPSAFLFVHEHGHGERSGTKRRKPKHERRRDLGQASTILPKREELDDIELPEESAADGVDSAGKDPGGAELPGSLALCRPMNQLYNESPEILEVLSFYESQFSRTTITCDIDVNPWQASLPMVHSTPPLMHAVSALSRRHRAHCLNQPEDLEVIRQKGRAIATLRSSIDISTPCEAMIATILVLIGLDYAESGFSNWKVHLQGTLNVLEKTGGLKLANKNATLRCQIAMLIWWDTTAALISRRGPVFPQRYLDAFVAWRAEYPTEWSSLTLNGCPDDLFLAMYRIACSTPNADRMSTSEVWALEMAVRAVSFTQSDESTGTASTKEKRETRSPSPRSYMTPYLYPSVAMDKFDAPKERARVSDGSARLVHCWQLAMVLYIRQVFYRSTYSRVADEAALQDEYKLEQQRRDLSRDIFILISEMPMESNWQKQCLLPVVIAGFELRLDGSPTNLSRVDNSVYSKEKEPGASADAETLSWREWVKDYCIRWKTWTGLWVFKTASELLTRVWQTMDAELDANPVYGPAVPPTTAYARGSSDTPSRTPQTFSAPHRPAKNGGRWKRVSWRDIVSSDIESNKLGKEGQVEAGYLFG